MRTYKRKEISVQHYLQRFIPINNKGQTIGILVNRNNSIDIDDNRTDLITTQILY
jgi:hypothetical protein